MIDMQIELKKLQSRSTYDLYCLEGCSATPEPILGLVCDR